MKRTISGEARPTRTNVAAILLASVFMRSKGYWPNRDKDLENGPAEKEEKEKRGRVQKEIKI